MIKQGCRVLVCGGRNFNDRGGLFRVLDGFHAERGIATIIHGAARGADSLAGAWAEERGIPIEPYPADWATHGKQAGFIRNADMLDRARPDTVIAFPGGAGTKDMLRRAEVAGVPVLRPMMKKALA